MLNKTKIYPEEIKECCIVYCENDNLTKLNCSHYLCNECKKNLIGHSLDGTKIFCPMCREAYKFKTIKNDTIVNVIQTNNHQQRNRHLNNTNFYYTFFWTKLVLQVLLLVISYSLLSFLIIYILCQNDKNYNCIQCLIISFLGPFIAFYPLLILLTNKIKKFKFKLDMLWSVCFSFVLFMIISTNENCTIQYFLLWTVIIWFFSLYWCISNLKNE